MTATLRLAALISGGGRTLMNLLDHIEAGRLSATVELVVASRGDVAGVERARARGLEVRIADSSAYPDEGTRHDAITAWLRERRIDLVCLCGYLRWFRVDRELRGHVLNIHPALLPDFGGPGMYGLRVHRAVLAAGRTVSGCTVHIVDDQYDHGPVVLQRTCPVLPGDDPQSLADRVFEQECIAYPQAIELFAEQRVQLVDERVRILSPGRASRLVE